jgi:hypothetical protein
MTLPVNRMQHELYVWEQRKYPMSPRVQLRLARKYIASARARSNCSGRQLACMRTRNMFLEYAHMSSGSVARPSVKCHDLCSWSFAFRLETLRRARLRILYT